MKALFYLGALAIGIAFAVMHQRNAPSATVAQKVDGVLQLQPAESAPQAAATTPKADWMRDAHHSSLDAPTPKQQRSSQGSGGGSLGPVKSLGK